MEIFFDRDPRVSPVMPVRAGSSCFSGDAAGPGPPRIQPWLFPMTFHSTAIGRWAHGVEAADPQMDRVAHLVRGKHLRASRMLLNWSRSRASQICGISESTIRRLEDDGGRVSGRLSRIVIATLRAHSIVFLLTDDGILAIGKRSDADP